MKSHTCTGSHLSNWKQRKATKKMALTGVSIRDSHAPWIGYFYPAWQDLILVIIAATASDESKTAFVLFCTNKCKRVDHI